MVMSSVILVLFIIFTFSIPLGIETLHIRVIITREVRRTGRLGSGKKDASTREGFRPVIYFQNYAQLSEYLNKKKR
jgi:hypothetical protein